MSSSASTRSDPRASRATPTRSRRRHVSRWVVAFVAVTVLHWFAAQWIERHRDLPQPAPPTHVPVQIALLKPQQIERHASPPAAAAAAPERPAPRAAAPKPHEAPEHTLTAIAREPHPAVPAQPAQPEASAPAQPASAPAAAPGGGKAQAAHGNGAGNTPSAPAGPASHGVKFSVPPSGDLQYDTFYNGMRNQPGTIHWSSDGQRYEMVVSVPLPFVGTFSWTSRGRVDAFGLAPDQYIEKRGHRPEDVTVFNRSGKQIVFTRTPNSLPLPDGAQDRFSMVMQLASLVRGDPDAYQPGVTREFFVADNDSGETWPVTTVGDESVSTDHGYVTARHFMRLPRREGDRRRIDVWLAPSLGWLPVRILQTEPSGTQFELVWRGPLTVPSGGAAPSSAGGAEAPGPNDTTPAPPAAAPDQGARPAGANDAADAQNGTVNGGAAGAGAPASPATAPAGPQTPPNAAPGAPPPAASPASPQPPAEQTPAAQTAPPATQAPSAQPPAAQTPAPQPPAAPAPAPQPPAAPAPAMPAPATPAPPAQTPAPQPPTTAPADSASPAPAPEQAIPPTTPPASSPQP